MEATDMFNSINKRVQRFFKSLQDLSIAVLS